MGVQPTSLPTGWGQRAKCERAALDGVWKKTPKPKQQTPTSRIYSQPSTQHIQEGSQLWGLESRVEAGRPSSRLLDCSLPGKAEPGAALLAPLRKRQAQLSRLAMFHLTKNPNQVPWDPSRPLKTSGIFLRGEAAKQASCRRARHVASHRSANIFS